MSGAVIRQVRAWFLPVLAIVVCLTAVWEYSKAHPVLPGITGCRAVRDSGARIGCYEHLVLKHSNPASIRHALRTLDAASASPRFAAISIAIALCVNSV